MSDQKLIIGYYRLSMEDDSEGESNSIINQRKLVKDYISHIPELAAMPFQEFYDDGYSGSSMERPAIKQVLELARENKVQCIVVKDFSRFARNYIEMGTYLEQIFPFLGVRFISISDRYDSKDYKGKNSDIEVQFKGLIADFYVKDQSVKVKAAVSTRRGKGEYCCGSAPYGYRINPENKRELVIVEDEAEVIRRVFELTNQRYSKMEICKLFNEEGVLTPLQSMSRRQKSGSKKASSRGLQWTSDMIRQNRQQKQNRHHAAIDHKHRRRNFCRLVAQIVQSDCNARQRSIYRPHKHLRVIFSQIFSRPHNYPFARLRFLQTGKRKRTLCRQYGA